MNWRAPLEREPELLQAALDATRLLLVVVDAEGTVCGVNAAAERATGLSREACLRPVWELADSAGERGLLETAFRPLRVDELPQSLLFHLRGEGTPPRVVDWDVRAIARADGAPLVVLAGVDLSHRLAAERHLRETEALQRLILDRLPAVVWTTNRELCFTYSAGGHLASLGLKPGQVALLGTSLYSYFHTRDSAHPGIAPHLRALAGESSSFQMSWFDRTYQSRVEPLHDREGRIVGCIGVSFDVTELVRTTRALAESEARLRRLVESNVIGIVMWDVAGGVTEANEGFLELVRYTRDELVSGRVSWRELTPLEQRDRDERALEELRATGTCAPYEKEFIAKDGARVPVLIGAASLGPPGAELENGVAFVLDLREQVRLREARDRLLLEEQHARAETEVANARLLLLVEGSRRLARCKDAGEVVEALASLVVPALADWSFVLHRGWGAGMLTAAAHGDPNKRGILKRLSADRLEPTAPEGLPRVLRTGEIALYPDIQPSQLSPSTPGWPIVGTRDPESLYVVRELGLRSCLCVPIPGRTGADGAVLLASSSDPNRYGEDELVLARELASRAANSLENSRLLSETLEAVRVRDEFLSVAAHELRTPLTALLLKIQILARQSQQDPGASALYDRVKDAEEDARRISALVDSLLDVSSIAAERLTLGVEELDLARLLRELVARQEGALRRAGCVLELDAPARVLGTWDGARLEQALSSLLSNAMKFGAGRPIEVRLEAMPAMVRVTVRDHGIGLSKEDQARIFKRFERAVSLRHFGGFGLGLYVGDQIIRAHGGSLRVESELGAGASFIVELPRAPGEAIGRGQVVEER